MTKISKKSAYPIKNPIVGDYFVGTDSENNGKTVNFGFEYAANLINRVNGTLLINYKFVTDSNIDLAVLTDGIFVSANNQTVIDSVTQLKFNKKNFQEDDLSDLFLFIKDNVGDFNIKLQNSSNLLNAVYLKISSVVSYSDYFVFNVVVYKSNTALTNLIDSNVYFFNFEVNEKGAVGVEGPQGEQGIQGVQGLKGDTGLQGIQGIQGIKGNDGAQGLQGDDGIQGIAGVQGIQGITGDTGAQGSKGDKGDTGTTGTAGVTQDISGKLDTGGFVGTAQDLSNRILDFELPDAILVQGIATLTGDTVSIAANAFTVRINQNVITNTAAYSTVIAPATVGFSRIDVIVANEAGSFNKVVGTEVADSIGIVPEPQILVNTLKVFFIQIDGAVIGNPKQVTSDLYVTKAEYTFKKVNGTGNKAAVNVVDESLSFRFPSADSISSISVNTNAQKYLYSGKRHLLKNDRTTGTFTVFHNAGTGNFKYNFPDGLNLVLKVGEIAEFSLRFDVGNNGFLDYVGVSGGATDISGKEDTANKSQTIETDKLSTTKYGSVKAFYDWAVAKFQLALVSGTNIRTINGNSVLGSGDIVVSAGAADPAQITITTTVSITTDTLGNLGKGQKEKNVIIDNGVNAINITVNGGTNFLASYLKHGTGAITFVQGTGRTLIQVDATAVLNGVVGSTATISSIGTIDYLRISNAT
jgi:hypothetical protein